MRTFEYGATPGARRPDTSTTPAVAAAYAAQQEEYKRTHFIANAFSLGMLPPVPPQGFMVEVRPNNPRWPERCTSLVGHPDTAAVLGVECRRVNYTLKLGDVLYVAQLQGGRLPEGAKTLPEGASFVWYQVTLVPEYVE